jgi:hypothetical protein
MSFMIYELPGYIQKPDGTLITHMILFRRLVPELQKLMVVLQVNIVLCNDDMEFIIIIEETFIIFLKNFLSPFNLGNPNEPRYLESWQFICCRVQP